MNSSLETMAAQVEMLVLDVDGVLTDGGLIYGPEREWKRFDVQDGHGMTIARKAGLKIALLTGRTSLALTRRSEELVVDAMLDGVRDKGAGLHELATRLGVEPSKMCYVGDDLVDLPPMALVGFPVAVANAVAEVKEAAAWVTTRSGGHGAVREVVETILKAKGLWADIVRAHRKDQNE